MTSEELQKLDRRDEKKFAQNKMEITQSYATHLGHYLRPFQVDGVNWLSFQWWCGRPAILADEMGLGKTCTVITALAKLVERKVWPHLILVPNSTILNVSHGGLGSFWLLTVYSGCESFKHGHQMYA